MDEEELLKQQSQINRLQYESSASDVNTNESSATKYLGYDSELRLAKLQDVNGNIFYGKADTNGAVARGEDIRLRRGYGMPRYDAMPHFKQDKPIASAQKKDILDAAILFVIKADHLFGFFYVDTSYVAAINIYQKEIIPNHNLTSSAITIEDTFVARFGHGGFDDVFLLRYYNNYDNYYAPIIFYSPTEAVITIEIKFFPGGGVSKSFCGISIDRLIQYNYTNSGQLAELIPSSCDAYSASASLSYTKTVAAGQHFISLLAGYNYAYSVKGSTATEVLYTETVTGSIKIKIDTTPKTSFYIQQGKVATKIAELDIGGFINAIPGSDRYILSNSYLTYAKSQIIVHIKTRKYSGADPIVHRYLLSGTEVTEETFVSPQTIPLIDGDWQNPWTTSYYPELISEDPCINSVRLTNDARLTNFYKNKMIGCSPLVDGAELDPQIKTQDFEGEFKIKSYGSEGNTCVIGDEKKKKVKLKKLEFGEIDPAFIQILAISPFYSPRK